MIDIFGYIKDINYHPFLCRKLKIYKNIEIALEKDTTFLYEVCSGNNIAISWWRSAKRTRTYPYVRVYDSLGFQGKKVTIIPVYKDEGKKAFLKALRTVYGPALVNGPFGGIVANSNYMVGLNDRTKLRPLVAARKGSYLYISSEEASIREINKDLDTVWMPKAGEVTVGRLKNGKS